jgi:hypothetical protein
MRIAPSTTPTGSSLRILLLLAIALDLLLIVGRALLYRPLWSQQGAFASLLTPVALLLVYAAIVLWAAGDSAAGRGQALAQGTVVGVITGTLWVANLALETFADLSALGLLATAPFLLGGFTLWGLAGFRAAGQARSVAAGLRTALYAAMTCVLATITFGVLLTYTSLPYLARQLVGDPDYLRSHWRDLPAFAIANTFDSAASHLLGGLLIGALVGATGGALGLLSRRAGPSA